MQSIKRVATFMPAFSFHNTAISDGQLHEEAAPKLISSGKFLVFNKVIGTAFGNPMQFAWTKALLY